MLTDHWERESPTVRQYLAVEWSGALELGLTTSACFVRDDQVAFLLSPLVGFVWTLLGFAGELYERIGQLRPFAILLNLRETYGALLGGLAEGWAEPWDRIREYRPRCWEPHLQIRHNQLGPKVEEEPAKQLVREIAHEIENAWGHVGPNHPARCYSRTDDQQSGEFDVRAFLSHAR